MRTRRKLQKRWRAHASLQQTRTTTDPSCARVSAGFDCPATTKRIAWPKPHCPLELCYAQRYTAIEQTTDTTRNRNKEHTCWHRLSARVLHTSHFRRSPRSCTNRLWDWLPRSGRVCQWDPVTRDSAEPCFR